MKLARIEREKTICLFPSKCTYHTYLASEKQNINFRIKSNLNIKACNGKLGSNTLTYTVK